MKRLKNLSLFKILLCFELAVITDNILISLILSIYLFIDDYRLFIIFILSICVFKIINIYRFDILPIGVVEYIKGDIAIVDKIFYKAKIYNLNNISVGDVIYSISSNLDENEVDLKNNILFYINEYKYIYCLEIKKYIFTSINNLNTDIKDVIIKMFYNQNAYDNELVYIFSYNIVIYYFIKRILTNKSSKILFIIVYSLLFSFQIKFILILIDIFISDNDINNIVFKLFYISLFNIKLLSNYSILISILFELYRYIDINIDFKVYSSLIFSFLFSQINILYVLFYKQLLIIRFFLFIIGFLAIFFEPFSNMLLYILKFLSMLKIDNLCIRGQISVIGLLTYLILCKLIHIKELKVISLYLCILLPIFRPFSYVSFIDVGQGDAILINESFNRATALIDTGNSYNYYKLKKALYSKGIYSIDYLIITHDDSDHCGNIDSLLADFNIENIVREGENISLDKLYLKYYDLGAYDNDNDNSLVYSLNIQDLNFLFTGDISKYAEAELINRYGNIDVDILKASHHGSNTGNSDYFVSNLLPKIAIISTSGMYNHPHPDTLSTFDRYDVKYYITKNNGNIEFYFMNLFSLLKTGDYQFVIIK